MHSSFIVHAGRHHAHAIRAANAFLPPPPELGHVGTPFESRALMVLLAIAYSDMFVLSNAATHRNVCGDFRMGR